MLPSGTAYSPGRHAESSPSQSHHIGADGGLVDKHQPGRIKHALLSHPAAARSRRICSLPFGCLQHLHERDVGVCGRENARASCGWFDPSLAQFCNRFYQGRSPAVWAIRSKISTANSSNGETLPAARLRGGAPLLIPSAAATLPPTPLTSGNALPASRRDAPVSTAVITRSRRSRE